MKTVQNHQLIQQLLPLTAAEEKLKQYFMKHPDKRLVSNDQLQTVIQKFVRPDIQAREIITEDSLIPPGYNVMALKHLRYLPGSFHRHDFFEINCVLTGACTYQTADKTMEIQAGDIVVFPPNKLHSIAVYSDDCIVINILIRSGTFDLYFFSIFDHYDFLLEFWTQALYGSRETPYLLFHVKDEERIESCILDIYQEAVRERQYQGQMLDAWVHVFLILLLQAQGQSVIVANPEKRNDDRNIIRIINHIEKTYRTLTLEELAGEFHYSQRQMMRILKEYTGLGFGDLIRDIKLKKAAAFLEKSSLSIQSIVETVGYSDVSHFYRVFKKKYGCTPVEYRASHQQK